MAKIKKKENLKSSELEFFSSGVKNFFKRTNEPLEKIAQKIGVSSSSVCSWKYGKTFPDIPNFLKLVGCGLSPFEIMNKELESIARNNDKEYLVSKNEKEIEFLKRSSISSEISAQYLAELEKENFALKQEIADFKNRLKEKQLK